MGFALLSAGGEFWLLSPGCLGTQALGQVQRSVAPVGSHQGPQKSPWVDEIGVRARASLDWAWEAQLPAKPTLLHANTGSVQSSTQPGKHSLT